MMPVVRSALASNAARSAKRGTRAHQRSDHAGQLHKSACPRALAAQLSLERHPIQCRHPVSKPCAPVQIPKMPRVGKTRAQHTLVAGHDRRTAIRRFDVGGKREPGCRRAVGTVRVAKYRWFTRMLTCITSGGRSMKALSMRPSNGTEPFHQASHFLKQSPASSTTNTSFSAARRVIPCQTEVRPWR